METEYTLGFLAGVTWSEERIIKLLESDPEGIIDSGGGLRAGYETAIALIKGKEQVSKKRKIKPDPNPYIKWWF